MIKYTVGVSFHFDTTYEVEATSQDEAEQLALQKAEEWLPYSSELGYTHDWYSVDIENVHPDVEFEED